ncbi:MAG: glycosyltransferase [Bacteroidales bacterium]|jgi:glycosyltransferase involved in cell wall biosynthesis|nr:glycosyltransferase [Bacteroidales bacterium]
MHITIVYEGKIPVKIYGGTGRDIWYLGEELTKRGHKVTYLVAEGSISPFADVNFLDKSRDINAQIPAGTDIVNIHYPPKQPINKPHMVSIHGNTNNPEIIFPINTHFVSKNHAERFGSEAFIYNGMNWDDYPKPNLNMPRKGFHFLGNAAWKVKNLKAAMKIARRNKTSLDVLGGYRFNFKMGMRFTFDPKIRFHGMVGNDVKAAAIQQSNGLIFPVLWNEPMGLAIIESLFYGSPVFGTPYGALPELVTESVGFLSNSLTELVDATAIAGEYNNKICHEYALERFNAKRMCDKYLEYFEMILNGKKLNEKAPQLIEKQESKYLPFEY